jgi:hypothetical protein
VECMDSAIPEVEKSDLAAQAVPVGPAGLAELATVQAGLAGVAVDSAAVPVRVEARLQAGAGPGF